MRKSILIPAGVILLALLLSPPWRTEHWRVVGQKAVLEYSSTVHEIITNEPSQSKVDWSCFILELAAIAVATGLAHLIFHRPKTGATP
jgi:hypothetical protein